MGALAKLVIIGAGGFGRECVAWARQSIQYNKDWTLKGLIDDNLEALAGMNTPAALLGRIADYQPQAEDVFICALGQPAIKRKCSELIAGRCGRFTRLIHRTAVLGDNVELGEGVILCPYTVCSANNRLDRDGLAWSRCERTSVFQEFPDMVKWLLANRERLPEMGLKAGNFPSGSSPAMCWRGKC